jgi:hypothetical protein
VTRADFKNVTDGAGDQPQSRGLEEHKLSPSDRVVQAHGDSVAAVCEMLHELCDRMDGHMNSKHIIHKSTIRCVLYVYAQPDRCTAVCFEFHAPMVLWDGAQKWGALVQEGH